MANIIAKMEKLSPEKKKLFYKKLKEWIDKKLGEQIQKYQEEAHIEFKGQKIRKTLIQRIPCTKEEREEYQRYKAARDNKKLTSFIDKVFFEDGALEEEWEKEMEKQKRYKDRKNLASFIDKVFFEDGALQLEKRTTSV